MRSQYLKKRKTLLIILQMNSLHKSKTLKLLKILVSVNLNL
jgi:hypothetical protein